MSFQEELVETACSSTRYIKAMATLMIFFGILSLITLLIGEPGTGPYILAIFNFGVAVFFVAGMSVLYWYCQQRADAY